MRNAEFLCINQTHVFAPWHILFNPTAIETFVKRKVSAEICLIQRYISLEVLIKATDVLVNVQGEGSLPRQGRWLSNQSPIEANNLNIKPLKYYQYTELHIRCLFIINYQTLLLTTKPNTTINYEIELFNGQFTTKPNYLMNSLLT